MPYSIVEKEGFRHFVKTVIPGYVLPSRKTLREKHIPKLYNTTVAKLKSIIEKDHFYNLTTDCWTSLGNVPYISLTLHFLDEHFKLQSMCLNCRHLAENHTGNNLKNALIEMINEWNIAENKIISCTTDNGANILSSMRLLNWSHVPCFGHTVNIGVSKIFSDKLLEKILEKVTSIQKKMAHSWKITRELNKIQIDLGKEKKKIPSFCRTRWWSFLNLIESIVEQHLPLIQLLSSTENGKYKKYILSQNEIDILETLIKLLTPIKFISEHLCGENYITGSIILPVCSKIQSIISHLENPNDNDITKQLKQNFRNYLYEFIVKKYTESELFWLLTKSTFIDPRFKLNYLLQTSESVIKCTIISELEELNSNAHVTDISTIDQSVRTGLDFILNFNGTNTQLENISNEAEKEYTIYTSESCLNINSDPLHWWKDNAVRFPIMSIFARKYLAVQGTSVPSERVFSKGGIVVSDFRTCLTPEHAEQLIFLSVNKKYITK